MYIDQLDDIVNKYLVDVNKTTYIEFNNEIIDKDSKFEIGDIVRISKYINFFAKVTIQIGLKTVLPLKKLKLLSCGLLLCYQ